MTTCFSLSRTSCCECSQIQTVSFWVSSCKGFVISDRCGRNLLKYCVSPSKCCTADTSLGRGMSLIACTFPGSTHSPWPVAMCPIKGTSCILSFNFSALSLTPRSSHHCRSACRFLSWSRIAISLFCPWPITTKSSAITSTPVNPSINSCIRLWKISGAEQSPNGIRFQR